MSKKTELSFIWVNFVQITATPCDTNVILFETLNC